VLASIFIPAAAAKVVHFFLIAFQISFKLGCTSKCRAGASNQLEANPDLVAEAAIIVFTLLYTTRSRIRKVACEDSVRVIRWSL